VKATEASEKVVIETDRKLTRLSIRLKAKPGVWRENREEIMRLISKPAPKTPPK